MGLRCSPIVRARRLVEDIINHLGKWGGEGIMENKPWGKVELLAYIIVFIHFVSPNNRGNTLPTKIETFFL